MLVNIKETGGLNIESGQIDPKATGGLKSLNGLKNSWIFLYFFKAFKDNLFDISVLQEHHRHFLKY